MVTDTDGICCLIPVMVKCLPVRSYNKPHNLFPNYIVRWSFYCISFVIILANICSIALQITFRDKRGSFETIVTAVNFTDISLGVYLALLWISDLMYKGCFVFKDLKWRSNVKCFVIMGTFLNFSILSPVTLCFVSLSRLMIVLCPIDIKFKIGKFVLLYISCMVTISLFCSTLFLVTILAVIGNIPTITCSPFYDPSDSIFILKPITCLVTTLQLTAVVFITFVHTKLIIELKKSDMNMKMSASKVSAGLISQMLVLTGSNVLCWVSSGVIYLIGIFLVNIPMEAIIWIKITILPLNFVINSIDFIIIAVRKALRNRILNMVERYV